MRKRLLAGILSAGLLVGPVAAAQPATRHHSSARRGRGRRIGTHALGGAAVGGLVGGRRGVVIGGGLGAGAGALRHRRRRIR